MTVRSPSRSPTLLPTLAAAGAALGGGGLAWAGRAWTGRVDGVAVIIGGLLGGWALVAAITRLVDLRPGRHAARAVPLVAAATIAVAACGGHAARDLTFLTVLSLAVWLRQRRPHPPGRLFRLFVLGCCCGGMVVETGPVRLACAAGVVACAWLLYVRPMLRAVGRALVMTRMH